MGKSSSFRCGGIENTNADFIGNINPIRYRGYYFDVETNLYYLNSRYYDPEVGCFISLDAVDYLAPDSIHGLNLFAYCFNNPIIYSDPSGHMPEWLKWVGGGLAIAGLIASTVLTFGVAGYLVGKICPQLLSKIAPRNSNHWLTIGDIGSALWKIPAVKIGFIRFISELWSSIINDF